MSFPDVWKIYLNEVKGHQELPIDDFHWAISVDFLIPNM